MENEQQLNPQQSLALIEGMIKKAQNRFSDESFLYLLWGWIIFICSAGQFLLAKFQITDKSERIWALTWVGFIIQIVYLVKYQKKDVVKTYTDEIISYVWVTFGITMMLTMFILGKDDNWMKLYPVILMLYGIPTFLSGIIMKFKPLKIGGITCWVLAIVATFIKSDYLLLLLALSVIVAWIIPGYLLRAKFKIETS
jgi:hypothetical protein